nr:hypothetical protein [Bacteroidales bacterium]
MSAFSIGFGGIVPTMYDSSSFRSDKRRNTTSGLLGSISATDLMKTDFAPGLNFKGEWADFLGEPERNFYMIISSPPGHGKTTFCIRFANYLADNFGRVIFFENEMNQS